MLNSQLLLMNLPPWSIALVGMAVKAMPILQAGAFIGSMAVSAVTVGVALYRFFRSKK